MPGGRDSFAVPCSKLVLLDGADPARGAEAAATPSDGRRWRTAVDVLLEARQESI